MEVDFVTVLHLLLSIHTYRQHSIKKSTVTHQFKQFLSCIKLEVSVLCLQQHNLLLVPILSQNNPLHALTLYSRGAQTHPFFFYKRPLPTLCNGLWATLLNITVSGTCNRLNSYMFSWHT